MTDQLTPDERDYVSGIAGTAGLKALRIMDEQAATLERVRCIAYESAGIVAEAIRRALADQPDVHIAVSPEAVDEVLAGQPEARSIAERNEYTVGDALGLRRQPEAPKGQDASPFALEFENMDLEESVEHLERDLAAANARIAELERDLSSAYADHAAAVNAANARVEKAEAMSVQARMLLKEDGEMQALLDAANARADAAEREMHTAHQQTEAALRQRDQLAARATELDALLAQATTWRLWAEPRLCTLEECAVLKACEALSIDPDGEGLLRGEMDALCEAELANRAAKAKREAK